MGYLRMADHHHPVHPRSQVSLRYTFLSTPRDVAKSVHCHFGTLSRRRRFPNYYYFYISHPHFPGQSLSQISLRASRICRCNIDIRFFWSPQRDEGSQTSNRLLLRAPKIEEAKQISQTGLSRRDLGPRRFHQTPHRRNRKTMQTEQTQPTRGGGSGCMYSRVYPRIQHHHGTMVI